ncbi:pseudouridine synthase [Alicyclobacillus acidocaldarius]|uniref:Pseudouridine synthase n=1 Tax=Alicyclobacillus acidocaldarius (strain Tc-4-1) TaxID=1048834 RepID=F8IK67_ALIAT|nr:pseudouridine synthase [Alicyclobacillus acidocaldarius]AEJ44774.1 pseudouridine synthase [Alicyclobacillus acidocaldarius subsp. acidocaldarius Tc-4-1]
MATIRVDKWLTTAGYGSRSEVKKLCRAGRVLLNGATVKDAAKHADPAVDVLEVDGEWVPYEPLVYFMMYKPPGYVSSTEDPRDPVVLELLDEEDIWRDVFPVGRLDKDAEGLLLLTNDGALAHRLLAPRRHVPKRYFVRVRGALGEDDARALAEGVVLDDGYKAMPAELEILRSGAESEAVIQVYEGKYHQVKRMFASLGKRVTFLKRISMGPLSLDPALKPGEYRRLTEEEIEALRAYDGRGER